MQAPEQKGGRRERRLGLGPAEQGGCREGTGSPCCRRSDPQETLKEAEMPGEEREWGRARDLCVPHRPG